MELYRLYRLLSFSFIGILIASSLLGAIIPSARLPIANTWETAGVEGGIAQYQPGGTSERTITGSNDTDQDSGTVSGDHINPTLSPYTADKTGVSNSTVTIQAALDDAASGQVVYLPAGTYKVSSLDIPSGVTLRGDGATTILEPVTTSLRIDFTPGGLKYPHPMKDDAIPVTGGATAGSTTINVSNTGDASAGRLMFITEVDDYDTVWRYNSSSNDYRKASTHRVVSVVTNTSVTFEPALPIAYDDNPIVGFEWKSAIRKAGIESLKMDCTNVASSSSLGVVYFDSAWECWMYDVEIEGVPDKTVVSVSSGRLEFRKNYLHGARGGGSNFEGLGLSSLVSFSVIVDNIFDQAGFPAIMIADGAVAGCMANVIAYNYAVDSYFSDDLMADQVMSADIGMNHNVHNMFTLVEGNYAGKLQSDNWEGSSEKGTILRNRITGTTTWENQIRRTPIWLARRQLDHSIVGNILGDTVDTYEYEYVTVSNWTGEAIYCLGYPGLSSGFSDTYPTGVGTWTHTSRTDTRDEYVDRDNTTYGTTIIEGNWDAYNEAQDWTITPETIPDSYYLTEKPDWFGALSWPPYDPANPSNDEATRIPAGYRHINGNENYLLQSNPHLRKSRSVPSRQSLITIP